MNKESLLITASLISSSIKTIVDECKNEANEILAQVDKNDKIELDIQAYNRENFSYSENTIYSIKDGNSFIGNFLYTQEHFIPFSSRENTVWEQESDKDEYQKAKKNFDIDNFNSISISNTTIKKIETKIKKEADSDLEVFYSAVQDMIDDGRAEEKKSFRFLSKESLDYNNNADICNVVNYFAKKSKSSFAGLKLLNLFGYEHDASTSKIDEINKDKILNILVKDGVLADKESIIDKIQKMNFAEKMSIMLSANTLYNDLTKFTNANDELKEYSNSFSNTISYEINRDFLIKELGENEVKRLLKNNDYISVKSNADFVFNKKIKSEKKYFIKSEAFTDLNHQNFLEFKNKTFEQKEMIRQLNQTNNLQEKQINKIQLKPKK